MPAVALGFSNVASDATAVRLLDRHNNQLARINHADFITPVAEPPLPTLEPAKVTKPPDTTSEVNVASTHSAPQVTSTPL